MSEPPAWTQPYIGIPFLDGGRSFDGADCYGLGRLVMASLGIDLPLYDCYEDSSNIHLIGPLIRGAIEFTDSPWREVSWEQRQPYDWVIYREGELPAHLGIVASRDWGLHTFRGAGSGNEMFDRVIHRLAYTALGCYRHRESP